MSKKIKVFRTLRCHECHTTFKLECFKGDPVPDCPYCSAAKGEEKGFGVQVKKEGFTSAAFHVHDSTKGALAAKAVDATYKLVERDYGMTNLRDDNKIGEAAFKAEPMSKEMSAAMAQQGSMFNNPANVGKAVAARGTSMGIAAAARAERQAMGIPDAMGQAMNAIKADKLGPIGRTRRNPVARA